MSSTRALAGADDTRLGWATGGAASILATIWLLSLAAVTWFVIDPLKYPLAAAVRTTPGLDPLRLAAIAVGTLGPISLTLLLSALLLGLAVLLVEWRTAAVSAALTTLRWPHWLLLVAILLWLGHSYLAPGLLLMGDLGNHIALVALRLDALRHGANPYWTNWQSLGQPLPSFYSPTTFWPITWIALVLQDPTLATKVFLLLAHVLGGLAAYALLRSYGAGGAGALAGSLVYAGSFAHLHLILYRGTVPQALSIAILPAALLGLRGVLQANRHLSPAWFCLAVSAAGLLSNYLPFGIVAGGFIAVDAAFLLVFAPTRLQRIPPLASAALTAVALSAFVLIPAFMASRNTASLDSGRLFGLALPNATVWNHLLVWRAWRTNFGSDSSAYLGSIAILLGVAGIWSAVRNPGVRGPVTGAAAIVLLSLFVRGDYLRSVVFTLMGTAILAGFGADHLLRRWSHFGHAPAIVVGILLLDLGSTSVQPLGRTDLAAITAAGAYLAEQRPPTRTLEGDIASGPFTAVRGGGAGLLQLSPTEFPVGGYVQLAGPAETYGEDAGQLVEHDLAGAGRLRSDTNALLCALRVHRIVAVNRSSIGLPPIPGTTDEPPLGRVIVPACETPVLFAPTLCHSDSASQRDIPPRRRSSATPESIDQVRGRLATLTEQMHADTPHGTADCIIASGLARADTATRTAAAPVTVSEYAVGADRVRIVLSSADAGFVRLSHAWFPGLRVTRNGRVVDTVPDAMGLIVVPVDAGTNAIDIRPAPEPGRAVGAIISAVVALLLILAACLAALRRPGSVATFSAAT